MIFKEKNNTGSIGFFFFQKKTCFFCGWVWTPHQRTRPQVFFTCSAQKKSKALCSSRANRRSLHLSSTKRKRQSVEVPQVKPPTVGGTTYNYDQIYIFVRKKPVPPTVGKTTYTKFWKLILCRRFYVLQSELPTVLYNKMIMLS